MVTLSYPLPEVWPSALRYLRIDRGYIIREKDPEAGYLLFELTENGRSYRGALELVRTTDGEGREATRAQVSLPDLPRHFETMIVDKLVLKVKEDLGTPPPPPRKPPPEEAKKPPPPDAGGLPRYGEARELPRAR